MMKSTIFSFLLLSHLVFAEHAFSQVRDEKVFVKHIVVEADSDPRFVWAIANAAIPWDTKTSPENIHCVESELRKTGLFSEVSTRLNGIQQAGAFELVIALKFREPRPSYKIRDFAVEDLSGVDSNQLNYLIQKSGLVGSVLGLDAESYAIFEGRLREFVKESAIKKDDERTFTNPLFALTLTSNNELVVTIRSKYDGCLARAGQ